MKTHLALVLTALAFASSPAHAGYHSYLTQRTAALSVRIATAADLVHREFRGSPDFPSLCAEMADLQDHVGKLYWFASHKGALASMDEQIHFLIDTHACLTNRVARMRPAPLPRSPHGGHWPAARFAPGVDVCHVNQLAEHLAQIGTDLHGFHDAVQPARPQIVLPQPVPERLPFPRHSHGPTLDRVVPPSPPLPSGPAFPPRTGSRSFHLRTPGFSLTVSR